MNQAAIEIAKILLEFEIERRKNTPTESSTVYQAGQDSTGAEAKLTKVNRLLDSTSKRPVRQTTEAQL